MDDEEGSPGLHAELHGARDNGRYDLAPKHGARRDLRTDRAER